MANTLSRSLGRNIGTITTIYTVPGSTTATIIGIRVTNVDPSATVNVTVNILSAALVYNLQKVTPILVGSALEVIDGGKVVALAADAIQLTSTGGLCDIVISYLEQT